MESVQLLARGPGGGGEKTAPPQEAQHASLPPPQPTPAAKPAPPPVAPKPEVRIQNYGLQHCVRSATESFPVHASCTYVYISHAGWMVLHKVHIPKQTDATRVRNVWGGASAGLHGAWHLPARPRGGLSNSTGRAGHAAVHTGNDEGRWNLVTLNRNYYVGIFAEVSI